MTVHHVGTVVNGPIRSIPPRANEDDEQHGSVKRTVNDRGSTMARHVYNGELKARTSFSPEKVVLGHGVEVILDITDGQRTVGLLSEEGRSGFLVATEGAQAQFLEMSPGLYSQEHAHDIGFIIYTVEGRWVLCSEGERCLMGPGSICAIQANSSMGMEVPFEEGARTIFFLLGGIKVQRRYEEHMKQVNEGKAHQPSSGMGRMADLPESHPAKAFARTLHPGMVE